MKPTVVFLFSLVSFFILLWIILLKGIEKQVWYVYDTIMDMDTVEVQISNQYIMPKIKKLVLKKTVKNLTFSLQRKEKLVNTPNGTTRFRSRGTPSPHNPRTWGNKQWKADEILAKAQMILDFDGDIPEPNASLFILR